MSWLVVGWLAWCGIAHAQSFYLEGPGLPTRAEAAAMQQVATAEGLSARVVRRFQTGDGWAYYVRVDGLAEGIAATEAAQRLADQSGRRVTVYSAREDGSAVVQGDVAPTAIPPGAVPITEALPRGGATALRADSTDRSASLRAALAAAAVHPNTNADLIAAKTVVFEFRRKTPEGLVVRHTWARRGGDFYLDTAVESGVGISSRTVLLGGKAALSVGGAATTPADPGRARDVIDRLSPMQVLGAGLGLPVGSGAVVTDAPQVVGEATVGGTACIVLRMPVLEGGPPVVVALDPALGLVREAAFAGPDPTVQTFDGHGKVPGQPRVPGRVRVTVDDGWTDEVEILRLELNSPLPDSWFRL